MTTEDDTWAQTLVTVTPEDDATIREISDTVTLSSPSDTPLILDPDKIVFRRSITHRQFIDASEDAEAEDVILEEETVEIRVEEVEQQDVEPRQQDAENQTYLQGIPTVDIPKEYKDQSAQTMYMATPCPPLTYFQDIMTKMADGALPEMKKTITTVTVTTFSPETPQNVVTEELSTIVPQEELEEFETELSAEEEAETEINDVLNFVITRAFWITDPQQPQPEMSDKETQTFIRYNHFTHTVFVDNQTQTDLTCEPKKSNTMLLAEYKETKSMILNYLEDRISKGLEVITITEDTIDELIDKCVEEIKYPAKEQVVQTIATYKSNEGKEDVIRKLKMGVVVDPSEASIIVEPLLEDLVETVCETVSKNAVVEVQKVLRQILQRTDAVIAKLIQIKMEAQTNRIGEVLEKRKKKIMLSMLKKETETLGTQTSVTGISEVKRIEEPKDILCSVCRRQSMCQWCVAGEDTEDGPREEVKILRTQDILLAYKPCYVIKKAPPKEENLLPVCPEIKVKLPPRPPRRLFRSKESSDVSGDTIDVFLCADKTLEPRESFNEWSYVTDATLMKPCSIEESTSKTSQTSSSIDKSISKVCENTSGRTVLSSGAFNALQILKNTFCTQESCFASPRTSKQNYSCKDDGRVREKSICTVCSSRNDIENKMCGLEPFCTEETCGAFSNLHVPKTSVYDVKEACSACSVRTKSHGDGFKIIPICLSQDSNM
ncbi:uncharacterized protein LOC105662773 isoform X2 [Megachile rotundata]|nr:PREDICTED: uncharacterized protein LOC105662773 isoform X2 [Megachile rotundata]